MIIAQCDCGGNIAFIPPDCRRITLEAGSLTVIDAAGRRGPFGSTGTLQRLLRLAPALVTPTGTQAEEGRRRREDDAPRRG